MSTIFLRKRDEKNSHKLGHSQIHIEFEIIKNKILIQFIMEIHISYFIDYTQQKYKKITTLPSGSVVAILLFRFMQLPY